MASRLAGYIVFLKLEAQKRATAPGNLAFQQHEKTGFCETTNFTMLPQNPATCHKSNKKSPSCLPQT